MRGRLLRAREEARRSLVKAARAAFGAAGLEVAKVPELDSVRATMAQRRLKIMKDHGVDLVLDVGANCGQFGTKIRAQGYDGRIVSFEPYSAAFADLELKTRSDARWEARRLALGEHDGAAQLHVSGNTWSNSLFPIAERHTRAAPQSAYVTEEVAGLASLDSLAPGLVRQGDSVLLKLDVQGYEAEVLRGASQTLRMIALIELELSLCALYEGQAPYYEIMRTLGESGYDAVALENEFIEPRTAKVLQVNALFERRPTL